MRRVALALVVAVLSFSASDVASLIVLEPCTGYEQAGQGDSACPPTCVTCGCCAQAVEPVALNVTSTPDVLVSEFVAFVSRLPRTQTRDILHVPKPAA